jgi:hypothetical protein
MRTAKLSAEVVNVTPQLAENFLRYNVKNRKVSEKQVAFLTREMKQGRFIENGEAIIFDKNGELKDGQHRLLSIVKSKKSYNIPIIRGVEPLAMSTYDTGKNRSAADVLGLNGFKNTSVIASFIQALNKFYTKNSKSSRINGNERKNSLTNLQVLKYCSENYDWIDVLFKNSISIYDKQTVRVLSVTNLMLIAYLIDGENPSVEVYEFLNHLVGNSRQSETATSYLYAKLSNSKLNKEPLNFYWVLGMTLKAWNFYAEGNPAVKYFRFNVDQDLPQPNKVLQYQF